MQKALQKIPMPIAISVVGHSKMTLDDVTKTSFVFLLLLVFQKTWEWYEQGKGDTYKNLDL